MSNESHVKDFIPDIDKLLKEHNNKICIVAGVGSGKSRWVTSDLKTKGKVLFINSRKAKVNEDVNNTEFDEFSCCFRNKPYLEMTNSKLGYLIEANYFNKSNIIDDIIENYDYIVIDEAHSIATDAVFANSSFHVESFIEYVTGKNKPVILMTGTVEPIKKYLDENGWYIFDLMEKCFQVKPKTIEIINGNGFDNIEKLLENNMREGKIVYFSNTVSNIKKLYSQILEFNNVDFNNVAVILGNDNQAIFEKEFADSKDINIRTYREITRRKRLPVEIKILLSTSTLREGINIENENIKKIFCENHILSNIIQFMGRIRKNLDTVYIIKNSGRHYVNVSEMKYDFAGKVGVNAANNYFTKEFENDEVNKMKTFINYMENQAVSEGYIRFNYISGKFELFELLYSEQKRLKSCLDFWETELMLYCADNGIQYKNIEKALKNKKYFVLDKLSKTKLKYPDNEMLFKIMKTIYDIESKQYKKINEELKKQRLPYAIEPYRIRSGKYKDKTAYKVRRLEIVI